MFFNKPTAPTPVQSAHYMTLEEKKSQAMDKTRGPYGDPNIPMKSVHERR